jgi:hypothetical protein
MPETTPLAAAAWRSLPTWRRRFLVLGEGRDWWGTGDETHSESQTQHRSMDEKPDTVCLSGPGRAATTVCLLLEGSPMGSHLSKSHATCKPQRHRGWWSKRHGQPSRVDWQGACAPTTFSQCPFPQDHPPSPKRSKLRDASMFVESQPGLSVCC